ncbi:MAG: hypothetical protein QOD94_2194 [Alphaproteobacteria bacterium]|nr:hypothetical protein [Alphaproteobacteria bacterium]
MQMDAGITEAGEGINGMTWNILGQIYVPKQVCESSFSWHATLPPGTFVPPHIHPKQDEFIHMLSGRLDFLLDGKTASAGVGDFVRLPMGIPHGIYNNSDAPVTCLFWVSPTGKLFDLFQKINNIPDPQEVIRLSGLHDVPFLP